MKYAIKDNTERPILIKGFRGIANDRGTTDVHFDYIEYHGWYESGCSSPIVGILRMHQVSVLEFYWKRFVLRVKTYNKKKQLFNG